MTSIFYAPLRRLCRALLDLRDRVREALAGEVARAVGEAVNEVVAALLRGGPPPAAPPPRGGDRPGRSDWADPDDDPWGDHQPHGPDDRYAADFDRAPGGVETPPVHDDGPPASMPRTPAGLGAVAAGLSAGRWWLGRRGSALEAVGVGVVVALAALAGGPLARAGAAVVAAAADVSAATDALGTGAARLGQL